MGRVIYLNARAGNQNQDKTNRDARVRVARNPNTPPETLAALARDTSTTVRAAVAGNPRTPAEILAELAGDADPAVRWLAGGHPSTPPRALAALARDPDPTVRRAAQFARRGRARDTDRDR